jgi:hypothetical protein
VVGTFQKVISASKEAEDTLVSFNLAYKNLGQQVGKTREEMIKFADDASKRTIFDDEAILRSQATLLKFKSVTGETFGRARQAALDLASVLKIDLESAANIVGRAIERPSIALRQLRQVGVIFSADQEKVIKQLEKTGQNARAAAIIMEELEKKIKGGAAAAAGTLTGALARAKTAFDNLFEVDVGPLAGAVGKLADTLNDPKIRESIQLLLSGFTKMLSLVVQIAAKTGEMGSRILDASANFQANNSGGRASLNFSPAKASDIFEEQLRDAQKRVAELKEDIRIATTSIYRQYNDSLIKELNAELRSAEQSVKTANQALNILANNEMVKARGGKSRRGGDRGTPAQQISADLDEITEAAVRAQRQLYSTRTAIDKFYDDLRESSLAKIDQADIAFDRRIVALDELRAAGRISAEEYARAYKEALDEFLPEVQVTSSKSTLKQVETVKDLWADAASSIADNLGNAISQGGLHGITSVRDIIAQTLRGIIADIISSGLKKMLITLFKNIKDAVAGGGSGGGGFGGILSGVFGSGGILGTGGIGGGAPLYAGGGRIPPQGAWVGENGMEYVSGNGMVYNANTMRGMGGGKGLVYAPVTSITVQGNADEKAQEAIVAYIDKKNADTQKVFLRALERNTGRRPV